MPLLKPNYPLISPFLRPTRTFLKACSQYPIFKTPHQPFSSSLPGSHATTRDPPNAPSTEVKNLRTGLEAPTFLGTKKRLPEFNLADHVVLVSGGAGGLGLVQSEALLEAGAIVYALDCRDQPPPEFEKACDRAEATLGTRLRYRKIDVTDEPGLRKVVADIAENHGRIDGLIAAAGINKEGDSLEYTAEDFNKILQVNVTGVFSTAQAVAREMVNRKTGGSICLIASMSGTIANRGLVCAAYNSSKAAVCQLARNLASEWGKFGIRVNSISPGYIITPMTKSDFLSSPEREHELSDGNMLGRLSQPEEYRGAGVFLISPASSFMTGADLIIDGGHHSW
ncbi:hypothetical protein DFP73DRAFT_563185 [Morchella snyderi]|nr:hypothetical protein DFP73DRAFT_563185 [Morchella snyderi]